MLAILYDLLSPKYPLAQSVSNSQQHVMIQHVYFRHFVALRKFFNGHQMGHCPADNAIKSKNFLVNNCYWHIPHSLNGNQMVQWGGNIYRRKLNPNCRNLFHIKISKRQNTTCIARPKTYFVVLNWLFIVTRAMSALRRPPLGDHYGTKQNHTPAYKSAYRL